MDHEIKTDVRCCFFGAGKKGLYWLEFFAKFGIVPKYFIDNNKNLYGKLLKNIIIYNPDRLKVVDFEYIFITCNNEAEIYQQLLELEINNDKIIFGNHNILNHLLYYAVKEYYSKKISGDFSSNKSEGTILLDLQNGMVLGGVEAWVYRLAGQLQKKGYQGIYLTTNVSEPVVTDNTYLSCVLEYHGITDEKDKIDNCVQEIIKNLPCTIICNFPQYTFWSACIVKHLYPDQIRIIAVQHSDDPVYYEAYGLWQEYIDKCLAISSLMKHKLVTMGMKEEKIGYLRWQVPCEQIINRTKNKEETCLQIGYAGRVTTTAKRVDLLLALAQKLESRHLHFQITIAGIGNYSDTLQQQIQQENLSKYIVPIGYIDRKDIPDFWSRQDIMVSCSEWEGHSISQSEAMAAGAVPVITDVSGARDDVADGYNGYIVDVGDLDTMADKIEYLYHNRDTLAQMGQRAHDTIYERQKEFNQAQFWDDLIKEVWQK